MTKSLVTCRACQKHACRKQAAACKVVLQVDALACRVDEVTTLLAVDADCFAAVYAPPLLGLPAAAVGTDPLHQQWCNLFCR